MKQGKPGTSFEKRVAEIQSALAQNATVTHNERILGRKTGKPRRVDVSIRTRVAQYEILIVLECKDHKRRIDVGRVGTFMELADDVGANKSVMVSSKGFTAAAKARALDAGIELCRFADSSDHRWRVAIGLPALVVFTGPTKLRLTITMLDGTPVPDIQDRPGLTLFDMDERPVGTVRELIGQKWEAGEIVQEPGHYDNIEPSATPVKIQTGDTLRRAIVTVDVLVEERSHAGHWPISLTGFIDEVNGSVTATDFAFDWLSMADVETSWPRVGSPDDLPARPVITLRAMDYTGPSS